MLKVFELILARNFQIMNVPLHCSLHSSNGKAGSEITAIIAQPGSGTGLVFSFDFSAHNLVLFILTMNHLF